MGQEESSIVKKTIETSIRLVLFFGMIVFCYKIISPFITAILGGIILAVAAAPILKFFKRKTKLSEKWIAALMTTFSLILFIVPCYLLINSLINEAEVVIKDIHVEELSKAPIPVGLKQIPLIGQTLYNYLNSSATDSSGLIAKYAPQLESLGMWTLSFLGGMSASLFHFFASVVVAGLLLAHAESSARLANKLFIRVAGANGEEFAHISERTIQNVTKGVIGVAVIESILASLGLFLAGVPLAGVWTVFCLMLSIVQVGILPLILPIVIYMFYTSDPLTATCLGIWLALVYLLEHLLKPVLLSKGAPVPMAVIFIAVIGGFMAGGFIGMFLGAVLFSIAYKLFLAWLEDDLQKIADREDVQHVE
jgi:predicted PurR-regulated permease PerM